MMVEAAVADGDVVSFLCHAGERYKEHRELLRRKQLEDERKKCPFKPTVTEYAENMNRRSISRRSGAIEKRLHELHAKRLQEAEVRRVESRERREAELVAAVRSPRVTARARSLVARDPVEVSQRWLQEREAKVARLREESLRRDLAALRPTPRITSFAQEKVITERHRGQSIEEYFMAKEEARRERMYLLAEQSAGLNSSFSGSSVSCRSSQLPDRHQQQQQQQMFKPHITEYAKRLRRPGNVVDRLLVEGSCRRRAEQGESCSFAPRVAPASTEISKNFYTDPNVLVHERLYRNKVSKSSEMRRKQLISEAEGELTGIPRISETSRIIMERKRAEETELQQSPAGRLHYIGGVATQNGKEKPQSRGAKENNEEEGCTFQPRINTVSERMWRRQLQLLQEDGYARTAAEARELLWRRSQKRMETEIQRRRELEATKEMTECTFRPRVGRSPERHIERGLSVSERNERWRQQRERRLRQVKQELERTQLSECSFHPTVDPLFPLPVQDAAPVSGYEAHVLRQEKSRRRKHEAEEWWRPKKRVENRNALGKALSSSSPHQRWQQQEEKERQYWDGSRSLSSPLSREASSSDVESTQFVVYQAPSCVSSVPPRSSSLTPQHSGVGAMVQSVKPSPVDFIINHHRAIVESARRR